MNFRAFLEQKNRIQERSKGNANNQKSILFHPMGMRIQKEPVKSFTHEIFALVETCLQRSHDSIFGKWSLKMDQILHVFSQNFVRARDGFAR